MADSDKNDQSNQDNQDNQSEAHAPYSPYSPYAPLPAALEHPQQSAAFPAHYEISDIGRTHPWRRLFARTLDFCTSGLLLSIIILVAFKLAIPDAGAVFEKVIQSPFIGNAVVYLIYLPVEAWMLSLLATTPAKWLFGIRVLHPNGAKLSYLDTFKRSFLVLVLGLGLTIPIIALITQVLAYLNLKETCTTQWDKSVSAVVLHKKLGVIRLIVCAGALIIVLVLIGVLIKAGS